MRASLEISKGFLQPVDKMILLAAVCLLLLHTPRKHDVIVNAESIVSMRESEGDVQGKYVTKEVRCVINTEDGKFISVVETCEHVQQHIDKLDECM